MRCDECGTVLYKAGDVVPAGTYMRIDDDSFRPVKLEHRGPLPASFDGHIAAYRTAAAPCVCARRHASAVLASSRGALAKESQNKP